MDEDDDESVVPRPQPRKSHRPVGYHSILIFKFTSKKALEYLRSISPGPFNAQSTTPGAGLSDSDTEGEVKDLFSSPLPRRKTRRSMRQRKTLQR
jgi:hypothetical protein